MVSLLTVVCLSLQAASVQAGGAEARVRKLASQPPLASAQWGLCVKDAATGKTVVSLNEDKSLVPGSTLKLFASGAALSDLGSEHRFATVLHHDGVVAGRKLKGNLIIKGGGDPSLGSTLVRGGKAMEEVFADWLKALSGAGVKTVEGDVVADAALFDGPGIPGSWTWEDIGNYYAASAEGLSINDNLYRLVFAPGSRSGEPAVVLRLEPEVPGLSFENRMLTGPADTGDNGYIYNAPGGYRAVLRGSLPAGTSEFAIKGALPEPALFASQAFASFLKRSGIEVLGRAKVSQGPAPVDESKVLFRTESPALKDIVRLTNKRSFNLYAEMLSRAVALKRGKSGSVAGAGAAVKEFLRSAGIETSGLRLEDACGLSRLDLTTARAMTELLVFMSKSPVSADFQESLVFPGDPEGFGHIKDFGKGSVLEGSLRIKSGSLSGIRSYSGYFTNKAGRLLAFTFIVNNYTGSPAEIERIHQDLLISLALSK
ncbi:MAG: D-alanyl-D-alanine carboxypeptidase/D-alanyl-D-alanine-endopeptidase [Elusimicrobia bacterium]|nr:D-alanyl-D-alanine carboxypeptidase/D-alanyl-D-alanine-endopeptidase [Elusimicrobiota bacterium]